MRKLTLKQKQFIKKTAITLNPTEAVRSVYNLGSKNGSKTKKKLEQVARSIASENLTKPNIKEALKIALKDIDPKEVLGVFLEIMRDKNDKDARIKSATQLAKLLDLFPASKSKVIGLFDTITQLEKE